jgi:D-alanyl-lipoteichoic acid acyltransferase DltB (MBOAT superfamily)
VKTFLNHIKDIFLFNPEEPLIFTRFYFWAFFTIIFAIYIIVYKRKGIRNVFLFIVSVFFYYKTSGFYFFLLLFATVVDYSIGNAIFKSDKKNKRKLLLTLSIFINLFVLSYFKYSYLFVDTINSIFNTDIFVIDVFAKWINAFAGTHYSIDKIILPVGISFFTFQSISYSVEVYRKKINPVKNILDFGFYVSFFPQLVAGPIVRATEFIPQIYQEYKVSRAEFGMAVFLILNGLLKKMFISDYIAVNFIDRVFDNPMMYGGFENLMSLYGYSVQVYCDFSGYTDIAIGVALLMGFRLPINFNSPYKALNVGDFWKRWHISLSTWLKDYLYIPLGGSKGGEFRTNINLMITMLLGGLWHGASWQFVIWGGLNGVGLLIYKQWKKISPFTNSNHWLVRFYAIFLTFNFITFTRIWFRADSMDAANGVIYQITNAFDFSQIGIILTSYWKIFTVMTFAMIIHWLPTSVKNKYKQIFIETPHWIKVATVTIVVFIIYQVRSADIQPFIYFQF